MFNEEEILRREAKKRVLIKKSFKSHRNAYILCLGFLLIINLWTSPGYLWVRWPALGWGLGLAFHYKSTLQKLKYGHGYQKEIDKEMEELKKIREKSDTQYQNYQFTNKIKEKEER
ncbi:2TM domain-containing protein [Oceanirhabdus sp. W0125-5]|uniref:2TM domain-containing protein n=1 Tax=Oceanirhabdus sp. W0125-5 TaxID=2999116 RepID=UPI0022F32838|nr:2TM domain-containing protein [Oceanirhabdus sp. W0125-5]WBW94757.1 2TM domain-containing protein [Oceanirhabdus sp. W0125-5]